MAVAVNKVAQQFLNVQAGVAIPVAMQVFEASDIRVIYGITSQVAVQNVDYTISLANDFNTFTIVPTASLIAKIDALIIADPSEQNYITVRRELDLLTESTAALSRYTPFTSREHDRSAMRDQQLNDRINRSLQLGERFVGGSPLLTLAELEPDRVLMVDPTGTQLIAGPNANEIENAQAYAERAEAAAALAETAAALAADRTYYVSTTGSDSNSGLSSGTPFATLQAAANAVRNLRLNGKTVVVNIANGTYTAGVTVGGAVFGAPNPDNLQFIGNEANPGAVVVHVTGGNCFHATNGAVFRVSGVTVRTTTAGTGLNATRGGHIEHGNVVFGACAAFHKQATDGGRVVSTGAYSITGGATAHMHSTTGGYILVESATITITGTPAFSQYFAGVSGAAVQVQAGVTWSGAVTGKKFAVHNSGMIRTFDQGLPGTIDGDAYGGGTMDDIHTLEVFRAKQSPLLVVNETDASNQEVARFRGQRATPANGDTFYNHFQARDDAGQDVNVARISWTLANVSNGAETGQLVLGVIHNGAMINAFRVTGTSCQFLLPSKLRVYTVSGAPSAGAAGAGSLIHISDESGGAVVAFSDGTVWRRVTDRAVIS